jgi:alkanesulfonate monooxygenase SsuD/methylene tetrahydromethanopterin reductase-like flavin-dependent oxidoreductase (luciferase family)
MLCYDADERGCYKKDAPRNNAGNDQRARQAPRSPAWILAAFQNEVVELVKRLGRVVILASQPATQLAS